MKDKYIHYRFSVKLAHFSAYLQVPVIEGFSSPNLTKRIDIAGRHITTYLLELLQRRGYAFNKTADLDTIRQVKEQSCFAALDYSQELKVVI